MKIKNKLLFLVFFLALVPVIMIGLISYEINLRVLKEQIKEEHYKGVFSVDALISVVVSDMVNIAFTAGPKIADLIEREEYLELRKNLNFIDQINNPEIGTGRGLGYHIIIATDEHGSVLARSNITIIDKEIVEVEVSQTGHIIDGWIPPRNFEIGFENAKQGQIDSRKIIFNENFVRREGYGHLIDNYRFKEIMGLTTQVPIFNKEKEQVGILFIITILNNNHIAIGAINAITGAEFTAITPAGEIMSSFFINPPLLSLDIIGKAKERSLEMRRGIKETIGQDSVFYTKERIYLKSCPGTIDFKNNIGTCYLDGEIIPSESLKERPYRFHFIAEVDSDLEYVSIRGIAYDLTNYDLLTKTQERYLIIIFLFAFLIISIIGLIAADRITSPIVKFTKEIQQMKKDGLGHKVNIKTGDEIETLVESFNDMNEKISQNYQIIKEQKSILEIKVKARTKELEELADQLDNQVKEKTKELQERIDELEKFHKLTVGREFKMIELKKELDELKKELELKKDKL